MGRLRQSQPVITKSIAIRDPGISPGLFHSQIKLIFNEAFY